MAASTPLFREAKVATVVPSRLSWHCGCSLVSEMKSLSFLVGLLWVLALVAGFTMWRDSATTAYSVLIDATDTTSVSEPRTRRGLETHDQFAEPRRDLYGNEVTGAVADYRVDPRGDLYERHAPDTAVLKLGPPGT